MRMWGVHPKLLCRQHLLGEHKEMHMFVGAIKKGTSIRGYIASGFVETHRIRERHDALAEEMTNRGYLHFSPLPAFTVRPDGQLKPERDREDLISRCGACSSRIQRSGE